MIDGAQNEATAFAEQALYVPAGEVHRAENRGGRTHPLHRLHGAVG